MGRKSGKLANVARPGGAQTVKGGGGSGQKPRPGGNQVVKSR